MKSRVIPFPAPTRPLERYRDSQLYRLVARPQFERLKEPAKREVARELEIRALRRAA